MSVKFKFINLSKALLRYFNHGSGGVFIPIKKLNLSIDLKLQTL